MLYDHTRIHKILLSIEESVYLLSLSFFVCTADVELKLTHVISCYIVWEFSYTYELFSTYDISVHEFVAFIFHSYSTIPHPSFPPKNLFSLGQQIHQQQIGHVICFSLVLFCALHRQLKIY